MKIFLSINHRENRKWEIHTHMLRVNSRLILKWYQISPDTLQGNITQLHRRFTIRSQQLKVEAIKYPALKPEDWWSLSALCWPTCSIALLISHTVTWESILSPLCFLFPDFLLTWSTNLNAMSPVKFQNTVQ